MANQNQPHKTISRWQLLELIGLGQETGLEGSQIRQILAAEYGVNPDYTSRLLAEFVQKGYLTSQPAPQKPGVKGARNRKVYIRTGKANDLADKPIPRAPAPVVEAETSQTRENIDTQAAPETVAIAPPASQDSAEAAPARTPDQETAPEAGARRRRGTRPTTEAAADDIVVQRDPLAPAPQADSVVEETSGAHEVVPAAPAAAPNRHAAPVTTASGETVSASPAPATHSDAEATPSASPAVHDALTSAIDQFSDLLLLQVAQKLGAFVANQVAPLERATTELCAQIDAIRARLDAMTQQLGTSLATPAPSLARERPQQAKRQPPADAAPATENAPNGAQSANAAGQGRAKQGKKPGQNQTERKGNQKAAANGQRKLKALLIGVPSDQEQPIRERFGARYELLFLGADARFGKVRAIKDRHDIVLGLEDSCSPAIKDAIKGHPHKAVLPHPAQLMDELEEYFQLQLEQSQAGSAD